MSNRFKNPTFLLAIAGLVFQALNKKYNLSLGEFQMYADLASYALIGTGIYSTFDKGKNK